MSAFFRFKTMSATSLTVDLLSIGKLFHNVAYFQYHK